MAQLKESHHFIHNVFANFYKNTLDYFSTSVYDRFQYSVISTYDKGVQYIRDRCKYGREIDKPMYPSIILNPSGDFGPSTEAGGRQYWRYPNLASGMIKRMFDPIYKDEHLIVNAGFMRVKGELEIIMLLNSFSEYCDVRMLFFNVFGGLDRIIYPNFFSSFITLPEAFVNYEYENEYTGEKYNLDWESAEGKNYLVRSTNRDEMVLPLNIKPQFSLVGLSDGSNRYGGTDNIAEWKLIANVNYELEMPTFLIIESDYLAENIDLQLSYNSIYSNANDYQPPDIKMLTEFSWNWGLNPDSNSFTGYIDPKDIDVTTTYVGDFVYKNRYFHTVTAQQLDDSTANILIILIPEKIIDPKVLVVNTKERQLNFGDDYLIGDSGIRLLINMNYVDIEENSIIELYVYEKLETF